VLCPYSDSALSGQQALDELLPPLTSSNAVDLQLYAILAIVIKEFVASWYAKITPDQTFVEEVVRIIAHCTRELEQRLRRLDLTSLLLDEIPTLVQDHVKGTSSRVNASAVAFAHSRPLGRFAPSSDIDVPLHSPALGLRSTDTNILTAFRTSSDPDQSLGLASNRHAIYHALHPHPAFTPVPSAGNSASEETQAANESYYRQLLVYGALAVLLPTEDLQSPPLRILVADVLGEMILGRGISQRACEGWLIWDGIIKAAGSIKRHVEPKATGEEVEIGTRGRLERFGLLAEQSEANRATRARRRRSSASGFVWRVLQYAYLIYAAIHFLVAGLATAATGPATRHSSRKAQAIDASLTHGASEETDRGRSPMASTMEAPGANSSPRPILSYAIWDLVGELIDLRGRAPWILGGLAFARWHLTQPMGWLMGIGATDGAIDK
jgi:PXA domain